MQKVLASGVATAVLTLVQLISRYHGVYQWRHRVYQCGHYPRGSIVHGTLAAFQASGQLRSHQAGARRGREAAALATTKVGAQQSIPTYQQVVEF